MTKVSFIGAGRVAHTLSRALSARGVHVSCIASRREISARRLAHSLPDCKGGSAQAAAQSSDVTFITVPDDCISGVVSALRWRPGKMVVHCSGGTEVSVLSAAATNGALIGGFHPLQTFADPDIALRLLEGCSVAIEGDGLVTAQLNRFAELLGMNPIRIPAGARIRYHAGANYAASFVVSLLGEAVNIWRSFGVREEEALQALLPLSYATLDAVSKGGLSHGLSGPFSRGDVGAIRSHIKHLGALNTSHAAFYRAIGERQVEVARAAGRLDADRLRLMESLVRQAGNGEKNQVGCE